MCNFRHVKNCLVILYEKRNAIFQFFLNYRSYFGKFFLVGPDATKAAQYIFSNDMNKPPGSVIYTCLLNKNGGIEADLTVTVLDQRHRLEEGPDFSVRLNFAMIFNKGGQNMLSK